MDSIIVILIQNVYNYTAKEEVQVELSHPHLNHQYPLLDN